MLVIRFLRTGKKNQPFFKIVVTEKEKSSVSGRFIEKVGFYNPLTKEKSLNAERMKYWLSVGAKPSPRVYNLLISEKIIEGKKIALQKKSKKEEVKKGEEEKVAVNEISGQAESATEDKKPVEEKLVEEEKPVEVSTEKKSEKSEDSSVEEK